MIVNSHAPSKKRLERTRHERASLLSDLGEPLKRNVRQLLQGCNDDCRTALRNSNDLVSSRSVNGALGSFDCLF